MFNKYSGEVTGVLVALLGYVLPKLGVPVLDSLPTLAEHFVVLAGLLLTYYRRVQRGDVTPLGVRK